MTDRTVLIVGAHGMTASPATVRLAEEGSWTVKTASRRPVSAVPGVQHVAVDLLASPDGSSPPWRGVSHLVYAAYVERSSMTEAVGPNVAMLQNTVNHLRAAGADLEHVVLIGGGKSYGEHLGPYRTPAKEFDPPQVAPVFYQEQERFLSERAKRDGFTWTVLRPDIVAGFALGSPMNLLGAIGVYAALSAQAGAPLRFPGSPGTWERLHQFTDANLLAAAVHWALTAPAARNEIFNVTNGDQFRWKHLWCDVADVLGIGVGTPQPMNLSTELGSAQDRWGRIVRDHHLRETAFTQIAAWNFADGVFASDYDLVQSTIKIRHAGFAECIDSHRSVIDWLARLREQRFIP